MDQWAMYENAIRDGNISVELFSELLEKAKFYNKIVTEMSNDKKLVLKILGCEFNIG